MLGSNNATREFSKPNTKVRVKRWSSMSIGTRISVIVIAVLALAAIFASVVTPHNPTEITLSYQAPHRRPLVRHRQPRP